MFELRSCDVECCHVKALPCTRHCDRIFLNQGIGRQRAMMRVQQYDSRTSIKPSISHKLVDIGLTHALFRVVDLRDALPFRVDDEDDPAVPPNDQIGTCVKSARFPLEEALSVPRLATQLSGRFQQAHGQAFETRIAQTVCSSRTAERSRLQGQRWSAGNGHPERGEPATAAPAIACWFGRVQRGPRARHEGTPVKCPRKRNSARATRVDCPESGQEWKVCLRLPVESD